MSYMSTPIKLSPDESAVLRRRVERGMGQLKKALAYPIPPMARSKVGDALNTLKAIDRSLDLSPKITIVPPTPKAEPCQD